MRTQPLWSEAKDDFLFRYTSVYQFAGNAFFCAIILNPDFIIDDVNMNNAAMYIVAIVPANFE